MASTAWRRKPSAPSASRRFWPRPRTRIVIPMMNSRRPTSPTASRRSRNDPAYYAFWLMNVAFGQRDWRAPRRQHSRTAGDGALSSALDANVAPGPLSSAPGSAWRTSTRRRVDRRGGHAAHHGWPDAAGLDESRRYLIGRSPIARNQRRDRQLPVYRGFFGLGLDYDVRLPELLNAVTMDDVNAAARACSIPIAQRNS